MPMLRGHHRHVPALAVALAAFGLSPRTVAEKPTTPRAAATTPDGDSQGSEVGRIPELTPAPIASALFGRTISRVEVIAVGGRWEERPALRFVQAGDALTSELARRAMLELTDTGRFANVSADAVADGEGVVLRLKVVPRRIVASVRVAGGVLDTDETLRVARVRTGSEVTAAELASIARRVQDQYVRRGHPAAGVRIDAVDTDDPVRVVVLIDIAPGEPRRIARRRFLVWPSPKVDGLSEPGRNRRARGRHRAMPTAHDRGGGRQVGGFRAPLSSPPADH